MISKRKCIDFHDVLFFLLLVFSFYFTRNLLCSIMMILFFCYTVLRQMMKFQRPVIPFFCIGTAVFILFSTINIVTDNVINADVAQTMTISLVWNLMMTYAIIHYIIMKNDVLEILHVVELSIFTTMLIVMLMSVRTIAAGRLAEGTAMNSNILAMLCVYGFVLILCLRKSKQVSLVACAGRSACYLLSILISGSRKGLIMIVLAIVVINFFSGKKKIIKAFFIGAVSATVIYLLIMNIDILYNIIGVRVENLITLLLEGKTNEGSLNSRQKLVEVGLRYIEQKPWTGHGLDCFKLISNMSSGGNVGRGGYGYYSHNNYIELLFGVGIIGLILYYIPFLVLMKNLLSILKKNECIVYLFAIFVSKLAVEYAYVSYAERVDAYVMAIIVGCYVELKTHLKSAGRNTGDRVI